jgi:hypothetical protein
MTGATPGRPVRAREIAELLAWTRRLSALGPATDPAERASYLAAKTDLLARIATPHPDNDPADPEERP